MEAEVDDPADLVGRRLWDAVPDAVDTAFHDRYREAVETGEPVSFEASYDPLDTRFEVRAYPDDGGLSVYFRNVTERRAQERALERRATTLRRMHDVIADRSRSFEEQVRALLALGAETLGTEYGALARTEPGGWVGEVVYDPDGEFDEDEPIPLSATLCERTARESETVVAGDVERDEPALADRDAVVEMGYRCYLGAPVEVDGDVYGTFCFYGAETRAEFDEWEVSLVDLMSRWVGGELERRRRAERLERFASFVSHDLRGPISVLHGRLDMAEETGDPAQFDACREAVDRMDTMIDDLLALARAGDAAEDREPVPLADAVRRAWETVGGEGRLAVETDRTLSADPGPLDQLLTNLLRNAVQHGAPDGGPVAVEVGDTPDGFYVADDGPGVPRDERASVFERGYTTETGGTGFGLAIVEAVADAHGWTVRVEESATGGARVEVRGV
jgi:signal transduction histidine kinase